MYRSFLAQIIEETGKGDGPEEPSPPFSYSFFEIRPLPAGDLPPKKIFSGEAGFSLDFPPFPANVVFPYVFSV